MSRLFSIIFTFMNVVGVGHNFGHMIVPSFRSEMEFGRAASLFTAQQSETAFPKRPRE